MVAPVLLVALLLYLQDHSGESHLRLVVDEDAGVTASAVLVGEEKET